MEAFADLDLSSSVSSTVDLGLDFSSAPEDLDLHFFCHKEGYEEAENALDYDAPPLPPYPTSAYQHPYSEVEEGGKRQRRTNAVTDDPDSNSSGGNSSKSFVACKVCGDKASGYHYGVTSCEGCKGFFRRSIQKQIDYKCLRDKQCLVIRLNRNRCQYCRFRKCLDVGMSKDSVRYGRVPKRGQVISKPSIMYDIVVSISDAHMLHCAYTEERTRGLVRKPALFSMTEHQHSAVEGSGGGSPELQKLIMWQQFAALLTPSIPQVVEFAKRLPGFHDLVQDDQLLCIKLGFFEVWAVHAARLARDGTLTFSDGSFISRQQMEVIFDRDFVAQVFNFIHWFNDLQLTDTEIAIYSAMVLVSAEREGIYNPKAVQQLQGQVAEALKHQTGEDHPGAPHVFATLVSKLPELRALGERHQEHLGWFRAHWAHLRLSPLFAEVFDIPRPEHEHSQR